MERNSTPLLEPIKLGDLELQNRIAMCALTRVRADHKTKVPSDLHVEYYSQRARTAGFILTECAAVSLRGCSFPGSCGIYTDEQVEGWKRVTEAVHKVGGRIFIQVFHCGRAALRESINDKPMAPSAIRNRHKGRGQDGFKDYEEPEEMSIDDIKQVLEEFRKAAENAKEAGFDGIELHGANGYLIDEFIRDATNQRTDEYGGSIENRCRFPLQVIDEFISVFGAERVGIKLTPVGRLNDMFDSNPVDHYKYLLEELSKRKIAFVEIVRAPEFRSVTDLYEIKGEEQISDVFGTFKPYFNGIFIANNGISFVEGNKLIEEGKADMVSIGRPFISNPDLVERFRNGWELTPPNEKLFYTQGAEGYIDYLDYKDQVNKN